MPVIPGNVILKMLRRNRRKDVFLCQRFLSIFYPPAVYSKMAVTATKDNENFYANFSVLKEEGYLKVADYGKKNSSKDGNEQEKKDNRKNRKRLPIVNHQY